MIQNDELRYKISDLHQLSDCMSNNSRDLKIRVADFLHDERLEGVRVSVYHQEFGVLFSYIFDLSGTLVTSPEGGINKEISYSELFSELRKFGFIVEYESENALKYPIIAYLNEINKLGFDKVRILSIVGYCEAKSCIVAFMSGQHPKWLSNLYSASSSEAADAFVNGTAINLSEVSDVKKYDWSWLDFVANIEDIIKNNPDAAKELDEEHWSQM